MTLLLYTDGLVERRGEVLDEGFARLVAVAKTFTQHDLEGFCDALIDRMGYDGDDDVALLALRAHDPGQPRRPEARARATPLTPQCRPLAASAGSKHAC